jgi:hypothetical protein
MQKWDSPLLREFHLGDSIDEEDIITVVSSSYRHLQSLMLWRSVSKPVGTRVQQCISLTSLTINEINLNSAVVTFAAIGTLVQLRHLTIDRYNSAHVVDPPQPPAAVHTKLNGNSSDNKSTTRSRSKSPSIPSSTSSSSSSSSSLHGSSPPTKKAGVGTKKVSVVSLAKGSTRARLNAAMRLVISLFLSHSCNGMMVDIAVAAR